MKKSELRQIIREEIQNITEQEGSVKSKKIGGVTIVNTGGDFEFHLPQGMSGEAFSKWKTKNKAEIDKFKKG